VGALGILGADVTWNENGIQNWFWGINASFKGSFGFGILGDFKLGFSK
jgi:hypothetical protein